MGREGVSRADANGVVLRWFAEAWSAERLFYRFLDEPEGVTERWIGAGKLMMAGRWLRGKAWEWKVRRRWGRSNAFSL